MNGATILLDIMLITWLHLLTEEALNLVLKLLNRVERIYCHKAIQAWGIENFFEPLMKHPFFLNIVLHRPFTVRFTDFQNYPEKSLRVENVT